MKEEAIGTAFSLMIGLPVMVLHDKYSQITKKEVDGKCREERFAEMILDLYDSFDKGYLTLDDIKNCVEEETGMKFLPSNLAVVVVVTSKQVESEVLKAFQIVVLLAYLLVLAYLLPFYIK